MKTSNAPRVLMLAALAAGGLSLALGMVLAIFGEPAPPRVSHGHDSFSRSAVGHQAFFELLRASGRNVVISRSDSARRANRRNALLLLMEPGFGGGRLKEMLDTVECAVLVLPKRQVRVDRRRPDWIEGERLLELGDITRVIDTLAPGATVIRTRAGFAERDAVLRPSIEDLQLVRSSGILPVIATTEGSLIGLMTMEDGREVWVLSDPDLIATHGLLAGDNAAIALDLVARAASRSDSIFIDETLHGHEVSPRIWSALGQFPLVLALIHGVIAVAMMLFCAARRMGTAIPVRPTLLPGRMTLVATTADLLLHTGHSGPVLARYLAQAERDVAHAHSAPVEDENLRRDAIARVETRRRPSTPLVTVARVVAEAQHTPLHHATRILDAARMVHRWRMEMLHGDR